MSNQGHWVGLKADTKNYFGFIYIIRDLTTGRAYIGKKQFYLAKSKMRGCKSKVADRQSPKWKSCCWRESDWRVYKGSSNSLEKFMRENPTHTYEYEIIKLCRSRGVLTYSEIQEQWSRDVLGTKMEDGNFRYFNRMIGAVKFRPPSFQSKESNKKRSDSLMGRKFTDETKKKMSKSAIGREHSEDSKSRMSKSREGNQYAKGSICSEETKEALRKAHKGNQNTRDKTIYHFIHKDGTEFIGMRCELCAKYDIRRSGVSGLILGNQKTTNGWRLKNGRP